VVLGEKTPGRRMEELFLDANADDTVRRCGLPHNLFLNQAMTMNRERVKILFRRSS